MLKIKPISTILFFAVNILYGQTYNSLIYKGNNGYEAKEYDEASTKYLDAVRKNPNQYIAHYNLGNALYRQGLYKEAYTEFQKAATHSKTKQDYSTALYNQGNALMKLKQNDKAIAAYKKALKAAPEDKALRRNYEIAMLRKKQESQQNNQRKKNNQQPENKKNKTKNQKEKSKEKKPTEQNPSEQKKSSTPRHLTKEQEEEILRRISEKEQNTARKILNRKEDRFPARNGKDW